MKVVIILSLFLALAALGISKEVKKRGGDKRMVCYYGAWAIYRPGKGKFAVEDIDPNLCTHAVYGFAKLQNNVITSYDPWEDLKDNYGKGGYLRFTGMKQKNPELKTLIAIGGWNEGSANYSAMASDPRARKTFVKSIVPFLEEYNFDGLDLDWEYPTTRGGKPEDKDNFSILVKELRRALDPHGYLLTAAVSPNTETVAEAYDVPLISKYLDFISVMCYDYHGAWEGHMYTGHNTPLYYSPRDKEYFPHFNVNTTVHYWLDAGLPKEKMNLGMALYGRGFTLDKESEHGLYAPAAEGIVQGPYTRQPGTWGYNEICEVFKREGDEWKIVVDPYINAPYAYNGRMWIGFDDVQSLYLKAKFARELDLGGAMVWSVETDDFKGFCHNRKYILINTIKKTMAGGPAPQMQSPWPEIVEGDVNSESESTPTKKPTKKPVVDIDDSEEEYEPLTKRTTTRRSVPKRTTTTEEPELENEIVNDGECRAEGIMAGPKGDCSTFVVCQSLGNGKYMKHVQMCANGLAYDPKIKGCNFPAHVEGCGNNRNLAQFYRDMSN